MSFVLEGGSKNLNEDNNQKLDNLGTSSNSKGEISINNNENINICSPKDDNSDDNCIVNKKIGKDEANGELFNNIMKKNLSVASNKKENISINNDVTNNNNVGNDKNTNNNNIANDNTNNIVNDNDNNIVNNNNNNENNNNNNNENGSKHLIESSKNDSNNGENHNSTKNLNNNNNPINENSQHESETSIHSENATEMNIKNEIENKADSKNIVSRKKSNFKSGRLSPPPDGKKFKRFESNPYKISNRHIYNLTFFNELQVKIFDFLHDISKHLIKYNKDFALIQKYKHYVVNKEWAAVKISEFNLVILMKLLQYPSIVIDNPEIITLIKWICIKNIQNYFEKIMKKNSDGLNEQALVEDKTFFNYINMGNKTRCIVNLIKYSRSSNRTKRNPEQYYYLTSIKYTNTIIVREYRIFISILANALNYATSHKKTEVKSILEKDRNLVEALKFYNLVSDNSFDNVKNSFKKVTYFDIMNTEGQNPVSLAIKRGYTPIAKYLIDTGEYDINDKDKNGSTSLILAVLQENTELINKLLDHPDVKVNLKDKNGNSAFFYAVKSYNKDYIEKFMNHPGVNINTKNNNKLTPCILTVSFVDKYFNISKYFLTNEKVDINAYDRYGNCALIIAMIKGKIKIVDLLLEQERLLVNNKNKNGKTVLRQIIEDNNSFFTKKLLTRHDIDINVPGPDGRPVIFTAIQYKGYDILKLLLHQKDVDINYQDPDGFSPLMVAVQCQNMNIINTLLKLKDLKINLKNSRGRTALRIAVDIRNYKIIKKLLQIKDIDLDIPDISGVKIVDVINQDNYQNANIKKLLFSKIKS